MASSSFKHIFTLIAIVALAIFASCSNPEAEPADAIFINGKIYTVNPEEPWVEAFAVKDGKFLATGTSAQIEGLKGEGTRVVDLEGAFVMPGLIDAHNHALNGADDKANLTIRTPDNVDSILAEVKAFAEANPDLEVIRGGSWNLGVFPEDNPHKELLDDIIPDRPVYLVSQSGHSAWVNSATLELAGINKETPITSSFIYAKDPDTGEPTGRVDEYAMARIESSMSATSARRIADGLQPIQRMHNSYGITTIKLAEGRLNWAEGALLAERENNLNVRLMLSWEYGTHSAPHSAEDALQYAIEWKDRVSDKFDPRSIKIFYDGALDSYSALLLEDYEGRPGFKGSAHKSKEEFLAAIRKINTEGIGVIVHVMGDASARELVDIFEQVRAENGENDAPLHLSHAVMATSEDLVRLKDIQGASVDFSPAIGVVVPELAVLFKNPIGEDRYQKQFNVRSAVEAGVVTGFGSDWPSSLVPEPNSFWYLETWITRKLPGVPGADAQNIGQAITLEQAIKAYTLGSAQCMGFDWARKIGSIEEGKFADFIMLDRNLFDIPESEIHLTQVEYTFLGGEVVFDRTAEENRLNRIDIEITNENLRNAIDVAKLNVLVAENSVSAGCGHDHSMSVGPGSIGAPDHINAAFAQLGEEGYRYIRAARSIQWEGGDESYWIQWTAADEAKILWAYDPEADSVVEVMRVSEK